MRRGRARTLVAGATALACFLVMGLSLANAATPRGARRCSNVKAEGAWASIATPASVRALAIPPVAGRLLVADGRSVYRSVDAGCSWELVLTLPTVPSDRFPFANGIITALVAPTADDVYLLVTGPHVVVSRDGGET